MFGTRLERWTDPHRSVTDLHTARVLKLVATWHLFTTPLGPLLALFQVLSGEPERVRALWLVYAPIATFINYLLTRSPFGAKALWLQVASSFILVVASVGESPDRVAPLMALFLPVLAAALCFESREVLYVQIAALLVVVVRFVGAEPAERGLYIGIGVVMLSGFIIILAIVRHRVWLYDQRVSQLLDETKRARALLEAAFDGTAHVVGGVFESVSEGFCRVLARSEADLIGGAVSELLPTELSASAEREKAIPFVNGKGELSYATVVHQVIDAQGTGSEVIAIRDVSHQQMHEANLKLTARLAATGFLTSGVAHEVNNAMMSLSGNCQIGARALEVGDIARVSKSLSAIGVASARITECVSTLKRFGSTASNEATHYELNELVRSTLTLVGYRSQHIADIEFEHDSDELWLYGVESGVSQILMNLLFNATDAVKGLEGARIVVRTEQTKDGVSLFVSDNGPGVAPHDVARVFQPFFTTKASGLGSGLGLSISARIATENGGTLRYVEQEGGACFRLSLPNTSLDVSEVDEPQTPLRAHPDWKVLLIDDEAEILEVLTCYLEPATVVSVASAAQAREVWSPDFDFILSDIVMPEESGLSFRQWVASEHPEMLPRIVLMTGSAVHLEDELKDLDIYERVVFKPISQRQLLEKLSEVQATRQP